MSRRTLVAVLILLSVPAAFIGALATGSVNIGFAKLLAVLTGHADLVTQTIVVELRLPRAASAFAVGGMLAVAGALLQVLLRNPLADPYVLGVSGGAAVAALVTIALGLPVFLLHVTPFAGALVSMLLVFGLARTGGQWTPARLLLTGVVIAAGWGAAVSLILALAPATQVKGMLFWLLGDLSHAATPGIGLLVLVAAIGTALAFARALNLLARGERVAAALGENPARLRTLIYLLASLLTGAAVTLGGTIGFVGLIVPHMLRLAGFSDHRLLLPLAGALGGGFLLVADTFARSAGAYTLPAGVFTALLGVPVFLFLLHRQAAVERARHA